MKLKRRTSGLALIALALALHYEAVQHASGLEDVFIAFGSLLIGALLLLIP